MQFNRAQVKQEAKAAIRQSSPKATMVTLVYLLLVGLISFVISMISMVPMMTAMIVAAQYNLPPLEMLAGLAGGGMLSLFISILVSLYAMVMSVGYIHYAMNVRRGLPSGYGNLFSGFSMVGRILCVNILVSVFTILWSMLAGIVLSVVVVIATMTGSTALTMALFFVAYIGFFAFLMNRILRYSMANYILLDRPELGAMACITESKNMMKGRLWEYFVLGISFIGWYLLMLLAMYIVLIPGVGLLMAGGTPNTAAMIVLFVLAFLASAVVGMWLNAYILVTDVGFYDCIRGGDQGQSGTDMPSYQPPTFIPPVERSPEPAPELVISQGEAPKPVLDTPDDIQDDVSSVDAGDVGDAEL